MGICYERMRKFANSCETLIDVLKQFLPVFKTRCALWRKNSHESIMNELTIHFFYIMEFPRELKNLNFIIFIIHLHFNANLFQILRVRKYLLCKGRR
jgi:hypothetical protein